MRALFTLALLSPAAASAQVSTTVLWFAGNNGNSVHQAFQNHIQAQPIFGTLVNSTAPLGAHNLHDYRFVVLGRPAVEFTPAEVAQIQDYLDQNGLLVIAGESNIGGNNYILAINALLEDLGADMRLDDTNYQTIDDACVLGSVPSDSPFLPNSAALSVVNVGGILPGQATTVIASVSINDANLNMVVTSQFAAYEGRILLTADADLFQGSACGQGPRANFWNGLWTSVCDLDGDGVQSPICGGFDCDDTDPLVFASFEWTDADGDGFGDPLRPAPCEAGAVQNSSDCDDEDPAIHPDADEVCDGIDNDCDGTVDQDAVDADPWYPDLDGDGFGRVGESVLACEQPASHVDTTGDCDDARATVHPEADEVCDGIDNNCDGQVDEGCIDGPPPPPVTPPGKTCGCAAGGSPSWLAVALVGLGALVRRRR